MYRLDVKLRNDGKIYEIIITIYCQLNKNVAIQVYFPIGTIMVKGPNLDLVENEFKKLNIYLENK